MFRPTSPTILSPYTDYPSGNSTLQNSMNGDEKADMKAIDAKASDEKGVNVVKTLESESEIRWDPVCPMSCKLNDDIIIARTGYDKVSAFDRNTGKLIVAIPDKVRHMQATPEGHLITNVNQFHETDRGYKTERDFKSSQFRLWDIEKIKQGKPAFEVVGIWDSMVALLSHQTIDSI